MIATIRNKLYPLLFLGLIGFFLPVCAGSIGAHKTTIPGEAEASCEGDCCCDSPEKTSESKDCCKQSGFDGIQIGTLPSFFSPDPDVFSAGVLSVVPSGAKAKKPHQSDLALNSDLLYSRGYTPVPSSKTTPRLQVFLL